MRWSQEPPEPRALLGFYCRTRPPGFWAPVRAAVADKAALAAADAARARDLLWDHLEGRDCPGMRQSWPAGWRRGQPETWRPPQGNAAGPLPGHSNAGLMTSTAHCM